MTAELILGSTEFGSRSFRGPDKAEDNLGGLSTKDAIDLDKKRDTITNFRKLLLQISPVGGVKIITTSDLPEVGRLIFNQESLKKEGVEVVFTDVRSNKISYAGMLNPFLRSAGPETLYCANVSPSLIAPNMETAVKQIYTLAQIFDLWETQKSGKIATAGSLILGEHDPALAEATTTGDENLNLKNLWKVFPTNSLTFVRASASFSHDTDNGKEGVIELELEETKDGVVQIVRKEEKVGGNEDFYYGLESMLNGSDCVVLINPVMPGEKRDAKIETVGHKVTRREKTYEIYATKLVKQHLKAKEFARLTQQIEKRFILGSDNQVDYSPEMKDAIAKYQSYAEKVDVITREKVDEIVKETLDKHFFFAKIDENGLLRIAYRKSQTLMAPSFA